MSLTKKFRVLRALLKQSWHQQTCSECGFKWMAVGKERPELIRMCDVCQVKQLDRFMDFADREYQRVLRKGVR
jgi:hypothetical protein